MPPNDEFNPYVGPRAFEREDRELFFGRSEETEEIVSMVFGHPVVLVYSESGAGKTSLFNAQVVPMLEEYGFQVLPLARVQGKPPDDVNAEDIKNLYVFNLLQSLSSADSHRGISSESLSSFLDKYPRKKDRRQKPSIRVLIIDQFEELFTVRIKGMREQQNAFFQQISDAVTADPLLRVVLVIREDYVARLDPFTHFLPERLRPRFRLVRLNREAALSAITEPLKNTKRSFAKGVAEELVEQLLKIKVEVGPGGVEKQTGEFVEPVQLQVVCERIWEKLPPVVTQITKNYVGDVDNALADFYVKAVCTATKTGIEEAVIRDWCEIKLITSSGTRSMIHGGTESTGGIPNSVVAILESMRLVRAEQRFGARWYELTHDSLIDPIKNSNKVWRVKQEQLRYEQEKQRAEQEKQRAEQEKQRAEQERKKYKWYLLPIFLFWVGGLIGYFAVRRDDPKLAKRLFVLGLMTSGACYAVSNAVSLFSTPPAQQKTIELQYYHPSTTAIPPTALNQSVTTNQNTPVSITLAGADPTPNATLTAHITSPPLHGTLSSINQNTGVLAYTPNQGYTGNDSFTFKVNNGKVDSNNIGIVEITVNTTAS